MKVLVKTSLHPPQAAREDRRPAERYLTELARGRTVGYR
jgi:hypothetical protein